MTVRPWLGATVSTTATTECVHDETSGTTGITKVANLYPFTDPIFQNFHVQQYITLGSAGAVQTYAEKAPEAPDESPAVAGEGHAKAGK